MLLTTTCVRLFASCLCLSKILYLAFLLETSYLGEGLLRVRQENGRCPSPLLWEAPACLPDHVPAYIQLCCAMHTPWTQGAFHGLVPVPQLLLLGLNSHCIPFL